MAGTHVTVEALRFARLPAPRAYVARTGGPRLADLAATLAGRDPVELACTAYVLRHPSAGTILVDTGLHPDALDGLRGDYGMAMGLMFRGLRPDGASFPDQLGEAGIDPAGVERVVMTHLHVDHTSGMRLLPNARFTCDAVEWAAATGRAAVRGGYVSHHLPPGERVDRVDFDAEGEPHGPFASTIDLLGDGSVRLLSTRGHTPGHLSVLLATAEGPVLLAGDAAYTADALREQALPLLTDDDERYRASLRELAAFAASEPAATIVPSHDPDAWRALGRAGTVQSAR